MPKEEPELDAEDILRALCVDAQANPTTFNAESLRSALEAADMLDLWEEVAAGVEGDEEDEDEEEDDEELDDPDGVGTGDPDEFTNR